MKKKMLIPIISIIVLLVIGIIIFLLINKPHSYIIIDINPAFKINLDKDSKVISIKALDKDAKKIPTKDLKGRSVDEALQKIAESTIDYSKDNNINVLLYTNSISNKKIEKQLSITYIEKDIHPEIIIIDKITSEDKALARKYKITEIRAHYINSIKKQHTYIPIESLVETTLSSLRKTEANGLYCDPGYFLDNDHCYKEKERVKATYGMVCDGKTYEMDGICYEEVEGTILDEYECEEHRTLGSDNKCHNTIKQDVEGACEKGEYDHGSKKCKVREVVGEATEYCRITPETDILRDHKCYGPKPTIGGGCLGNDVIMNGGCVDLSRYYEADWKCPNGELLPQWENDHNCYDEIIVEPTSYYCEEKDFKVVNGECIKEETVNATKKVSCPEGTTKVSNRCIYYNKVKPQIEGYRCDMPASRLDGDMCVLYDEKDAKSK